MESQLIHIIDPQTRKIGFRDSDGRQIIPFVYDEVGVWQEGLIFVRRERWIGFLNANGDECISLRDYIVDAKLFIDGLCTVKKKDSFGQIKSGAINKKGELVIPAKYDLCINSGEGVVFATKGTWRGFVAPNEEQIDLSSFELKETSFFCGLFVVGKEGKYGILKWGCIDRYGKIRIPIVYDSIESISEGFATVSRNGKFGIVNYFGMEMAPPCYNAIRIFKNGMCAVRLKGLWGFVNESGSPIVPLEYQEVKDFSERIAAVKKNNKWGFVNQKGKLITEYIFDDVKSFSEGLCAVKRNGWNDKWGFINSVGELVIPCKYAETGSFENGQCRVKRTGMVLENDNPWGIINHQGEFVKVWDDNTADIITGKIGNTFENIAKGIYVARNILGF